MGERIGPPRANKPKHEKEYLPDRNLRASGIKALVKPDPIKVSKGEFNGKCERTECNRKKARWFNSSTLRYYCKKCAFKINDFAQKYDGVEKLCRLKDEGNNSGR